MPEMKRIAQTVPLASQWPPLILGMGGVGGEAALKQEELAGFRGDICVPRLECGTILSRKELIRSVSQSVSQLFG